MPTKHDYMNLARGIRSIIQREGLVVWPFDGPKLTLSIDDIKGGTDGLHGRLTNRKPSGQGTWVKLPV